MLYELKRGRAAYITFEELQEDFVIYGFTKEQVTACMENPYNFRSDPNVCDHLIFFVLDLINFYDVFGMKNRLAVYLQNDLCLFVKIQDENNQICQLFQQVAQYYEDTKHDKQWQTPGMFLYHFFDVLIRQERKILENMEFHMSILETQVLKEKPDAAFINDILSLKRELMYIGNYYEQLIDVGEVLKDNENLMLSEDEVRMFRIFVQRVERLKDTVKHLKEYTVQLRETHDAMLDYNLNNIMKLFTVITTVFLPLTLIVGWYGMNFEYMPEIHWKYGYLAVVLLSIGIVGGCLIIFRKYRLL